VHSLGCQKSPEISVLTCIAVLDTKASPDYVHFVVGASKLGSGALSGFLAVVFSTAFAFGQAGYGKGQLSGIVVDEDARPVAGARIVLRLVESGVISGFGRHASSIPESAVVETVTDKKGIWAYNGLTTGLWEVRASKEGYDLASRKVQVLQLSSNPSVKLRLDKIKSGAGSFGLAPDLLEQANALYSRNKFAEALVFYRQYLEKDPESVMVMLAVGDCLRDMGNTEEAIMEFLAVVDKTKTNPGDQELLAQALTGLGESYFKAGDRNNAVKYWTLAVNKSELSEIPAANLGEIFFSEAKPDEAIKYYLIATKIAPGQADLHYKLGLVYLNIGDDDKARSRFSNVIKLQPNSELAGQARKMIGEIAKRKLRR
jgi:TolA-binding protein